MESGRQVSGRGIQINGVVPSRVFLGGPRAYHQGHAHRKAPKGHSAYWQNKHWRKPFGPEDELFPRYSVTYRFHWLYHFSLSRNRDFFFFFMMNLSTILSKLILPSSVSLGQFAFTVSGDLCTLVSVHLALAVAEQIGSRASS